MDKCEYDLKNYRDWEECYWPRQIAPSKISITLHTLWKPNFQTWPMLAGSEDLGFEPTKTWRIFWMNYNNTCKLATTEPYGVKKKKHDNHLSELCSCLFLFHSSMCNKVVENFTCKTQHTGHVRVNSDKRHGLKKGHRTAEMATNDTKMGWNCDKDRERCKYNSKILIVTGPP